MFKHVLFFIIAVAAVAHAKAAEVPVAASATVSKSILNIKENNEAAKKISATYDLSTSSNLKPSGSDEFEQEISFSLSPIYKVKENLNLSSSLALSHSLTGFRDTTVNNVPVTLKKTIEVTPALRNGVSATAILPTNENSREIDSFNAAASLGVDVTQSTSINKTPTSINALVSALKNSHSYTRTALGKANLSERVRFQLSLAAEVKPKVSLSLMGQYNAGRTYDQALRTSFVLQETLTLTTSKSTSIYLAHSNEGNALSANGTDSNINIYDKNNSTIAVGLTGGF
jgi:hypothetical protein